MKGMNIRTGRVIEGDQHLIQTIETYLFTLRDTRVLIRDYGVGFEIDALNTPAHRSILIAGIFEELLRFHNNIYVLEVTATPLEDDQNPNTQNNFAITISASSIPNNNIIKVMGVI